MTEPRALRVLLVANDGLSAGHVARMIAIARGLALVGPARGVAVRTVLATTSQAHALLDTAGAVAVRLPSPAVARQAGFSDMERRRLVSGAIEGVVRAFTPDLVAIDTFPLGPHRELAGVDLGYARRALVRRHVPAGAEKDLAEGSELLDLAILADDPDAIESSLPCRKVRVPPITIPHAALDRAEARRALGLPPEARVLLVAAGGGGDEAATARAIAIAMDLRARDPECLVALALGPLAPEPRLGVDRRVIPLRVAPLAPYLAAFDGAIAPAGYNTVHELALAGIPTSLFAQSRPFDDQAARAARFGATLDAMKPLRPIARGGAERAAEALLDLAMGRT